MDSREIELKKLGFIANEDQQCYGLYKYDCNWYVNYWDIRDLSNNDWYILVEYLKKDIQVSKKGLKLDEMYIAGRISAEKELKKKLKDSYNHYNSKLKQLTYPKLTKTINQLEEIRLSSKVELLKELLNGK